MDVVSPETSAVEDNNVQFGEGETGRRPHSTHHGTPLIGTSHRTRISLERGGVPWVDSESLSRPAEVGTRQLEFPIIQLEGFPG